MREAYIIDAIRTPIGNFGGTLAAVRTDDLGAIVIKELMKRNPSVIQEEIEDVLFGCANQAGEDNRNVARMCGLLAGLPWQVGGETINRLCSSRMASAINDSILLLKAKFCSLRIICSWAMFDTASSMGINDEFCLLNVAKFG